MSTRRDFITLLGGAAAWPLAARAQQRSMHVIGLLSGQSSSAGADYLAALRAGLAETGFVEGRNLAIVYRSAEGVFNRLPALAMELVNLQVAAIAAVGSDNATLAAKAATATIPIVFATAGDPVGSGLVASLNRPGGNVTGATALNNLLAPKHIGLLRDMVPKLTTIGLLLSAPNPQSSSILRDVQAAAQSLGLRMVAGSVTTDHDFDTAFSEFVTQHIDALVIGAAPEFNRLRDRVIALTKQHAIPAIFNIREFAADGGMMAYGADFRDTYRQVGIYVGRILKGDKPADLPVMQAAKFELVINMETVKALGLTVPSGLLAIADEVIE